MIKFCIFAEPRSGTTFLNRSMNYHPEIFSFGEIMPSHEGVHSFHRFWLSEIKKDEANISLQNLNTVFERYIRASTLRALTHPLLR
jgi:hypothetical protein